jgi:RimJ/RimL family protein N-acetyltransferase
MDDLDRVVKLLGDPDVMRYMPGGEPWPIDKAEKELRGIIAEWEERGYGRWAVIDDNGAMIGWCGLGYLKELDETEVAYLMDKGYWNKGYATEGGLASLRYGFEAVGLEKIVALAFPENAASRRVMEKLGMSFEGVIHIWKLNLVKYSITREEFLSTG